MTMRYYLITTAIVAILTVYESGVGASETEELPYERTKLFNWDYKDLGTSAFEDAPYSPRKPIGHVDTQTCPDGWIQWSESCYYIEQDVSGFVKAEKGCYDKNSTLFVANSIDEWNAIRQHSKKSYFSWIGLVRFTQYEKTEQLPRWQTEGGINPSKINWLSKPYKPLSNGWSSISNCAVHYNSPVAIETSSYVFYQPCVLLMNSICERNATLINLSN